ncbi:MAG: hypothetical protein VCF07_03850 [Nitrospinota bacterium]
MPASGVGVWPVSGRPAVDEGLERRLSGWAAAGPVFLEKNIFWILAVAGKWPQPV